MVSPAAPYPVEVVDLIRLSEVGGVRGQDGHRRPIPTLTCHLLRSVPAGCGRVGHRTVVHVGLGHRVAAGAGLRGPGGQRGVRAAHAGHQVVRLTEMLVSVPAWRWSPGSCRRWMSPAAPYPVELVDLVRREQTSRSHRHRTTEFEVTALSHGSVAAGRGRVGHRAGVHVGLGHRVAAGAGLRRARGERGVGAADAGRPGCR